ncbi:hypothetical protein PINS_up007511 [Pythium insidiosum]|nr:hypothetical protein PINS_up007511 [Pythium insidiosum]
MNQDAATRAWLKQELVSVLGFAEVDEILSYVLSSFQSKAEVESYLCELLGLPSARAQTISSRLFSAKPAAAPKHKQQKQQQQQQQQQTSSSASSSSSKPLVPKPEAPNSRLKQTKSKKPSKLLHSRIINCLQCGRIEINAARRCAFCDNELQYEEMDGNAAAASAARAHMEQLVAFDESGTERTTVIDTEEQLYDHVPDAAGDGERHRRPIVLTLDLQNRTFADAAPASVANQQLHKDARELLETLQQKMAKAAKGRRSDPAAATVEPVNVSVDDEYNALYV